MAGYPASLKESSRASATHDLLGIGTRHVWPSGFSLSLVCVVRTMTRLTVFAQASITKQIPTLSLTTIPRSRFRSPCTFIHLTVLSNALGTDMPLKSICRSPDAANSAGTPGVHVDTFCHALDPAHYRSWSYVHPYDPAYVSQLFFPIRVRDWHGCPGPGMSVGVSSCKGPKLGVVELASPSAWVCELS